MGGKIGQHRASSYVGILIKRRPYSFCRSLIEKDENLIDELPVLTPADLEVREKCIFTPDFRPISMTSSIRTQNCVRPCSADAHKTPSNSAINLAPIRSVRQCPHRRRAYRSVLLKVQMPHTSSLAEQSPASVPVLHGRFCGLSSPIASMRTFHAGHQVAFVRPTPLSSSAFK